MCQSPTSLHSEFQHVTGIGHVRRVREKIRVPGFVEDFSEGIGCDTYIEPWEIQARFVNIQNANVEKNMQICDVENTK